MIIDNDKFHRLMARIDSHRDEMVQMQRELCAIPAVGPENGGDGELAKATFLQKRLVEMGFTGIRNYNASDERVSSGIRPNLIVTVPGTNSTKFIWIITHLDIVPPGEIKLWSHNPYDAIVRDGHIYGRGVEDNQQDMVSSIFAAQSLREEGIIPFNSIRLAFIADEEAARVKGLLHVLETNQNIFSKDDLIIVPDSGNPAGSFIEIAEKSMLWLRFRTIGKQCHGSKPQLGKNAFVAASHLVTKLIHLKKLFPHTDAIFDPPASTFEPTKKEANVGNINTIPGEDVFCMDCRILPCYKLDDVQMEIAFIIKKIEKKFKVTVECSEVYKMQSAPATDADAPVIKALISAIKKVYGIEPVLGGVGAGTFAADLRRYNLPVAVWSKNNQTAHQPDENCNIDNMVGNAKVFGHIFLQD